MVYEHIVGANEIKNKMANSVEKAMRFTGSFEILLLSGLNENYGAVAKSCSVFRPLSAFRKVFSIIKKSKYVHVTVTTAAIGAKQMK